MSERGCFIANAVYAGAETCAVLEKHLPELLRLGCPLIAQPGRLYAGAMHGGYGGEEAAEVAWWIEEKLLNLLPTDHGWFSLTVVPDVETMAAIFVFERESISYKMYNLNPTPWGTKA